MAFFDLVRRMVPGRAPSEPFARGVHALARGRLDQADAAFAEALARADGPRERAAALNKRAIVAIRRKDREAAVALLVAALEADPRTVAAIVTVGNLLLEDGAVDDAILHYEAALRIDDAYAPAYHNLGVAQHRQGRRGEAVRNLRKATRLEARMKR